jgi:hypothetical protein
MKDTLERRRLSLFGHVARLAPDVPAHQILEQSIQCASGHPPAGWKRRRGRPRTSWQRQLANSTQELNKVWQDAIDRGHCSDRPAQRALDA